MLSGLGTAPVCYTSETDRPSLTRVAAATIHHTCPRNEGFIALLFLKTGTNVAHNLHKAAPNLDDEGGSKQPPVFASRGPAKQAP